MAHRNNRLEELRKAMKNRDIPAFLVSKNENQSYLSGFRSSEYYLIITAAEAYLLTDFRYAEAAKNEAHQFHIVETNPVNTLFTFLKELDPPALAIEHKAVTHAFFTELSENTELTLLDGDGMLEELRHCKDPGEQAAMQKAQSITDLCFTHILNFLKPGRKEMEIAWEIERFMRENGAERLSFETICVSGIRTSLPHGTPSEKIVETGDFVTLDFGCVVDGYCSDMTRTVAIGRVTEEQKRIYNTVLTAQKTACAGIRSGLSCLNADKLARDIIASEGFGEAFGHGTGHGVGLEIHEAPTLNARSSEILRTNMAITIEPGIYLPGKFGVRIEDLAFVSDSSIINTTKSEKELIVL